MLSAKDAANQTFIGRASVSHGHELQTIEQRIKGAAAAGLASVEVVFEGNVFDEDTAEIVKQVLLDSEYKVSVRQNKKLGNLASWQFNISW